MLNFFRVYSGIDLIIVCMAFLIAILFALTIHEYSHSLIATVQGDYTSRNFGRLTLNPFKHIDPVGFLCLILFGFGWAKPVPINSYKFKNYKKGLFLTSISGICTNFVASFVFVGILVLSFGNIGLEQIASLNYLVQFCFYLLYFSASINLGLALFNVIPIPPLDGFNAVCSFTKGTSKFTQFLRTYGYFVLLLLLIFNVIDMLFTILYNFILPAFASFWQFVF